MKACVFCGNIVTACIENLPIDDIDLAMVSLIKSDYSSAEDMKLSPKS